MSVSAPSYDVIPLSGTSWVLLVPAGTGFSFGEREGAFVQDSRLRPRTNFLLVEQPPPVMTVETSGPISAPGSKDRTVDTLAMPDAEC